MFRYFNRQDHYMGAYTYQHMHTGNHDNNGIGVNVYYLPCISDKWENPNVEEH